MGWRLLLILALVLAQSSAGQTPRGRQLKEQIGFGAEAVPGEVFVQNPVQVSKDALEILKGNLSPGTINCIKNVAHLTPDQVPAAWFVGSEVHLDGADKKDLVVLPNVPQILASDSSPDVRNGGCLLGANVGPFWVLRQRDKQYELLLATSAAALFVLDSKTNGYRDIQTDLASAVRHTALLFKFDGHQYKLVQGKDANVNK